MVRARSRRPTSDLVDLAIRHFELGEPIDALATDQGVEQSTIRRLLGRAKKEGLVRTLVVPPLEDEERTRLRRDVRYAFELEDVVPIPGREDILDMTEDTAPKEALVLSIAQAAARYLEEHLTNRDILLVPWGRMANYITRQIKAPRPLPGLTVVPMVGVMGVEHDPFEANILASTIAAKFGGRAYLLPAPAVADNAIGKIIESLPLVRRVMALYEEATVALVPLASPDPERSSVVRNQVLTSDMVRSLVARGAVGEIASHWWFDAQGRIVEQGEIHAIGLGLDGLARMVQRRAKVIAVVGASRERVHPLKVALRHRLLNILITDHVTAQMLLA